MADFPFTRCTETDAEFLSQYRIVPNLDICEERREPRETRIGLLFWLMLMFVMGCIGVALRGCN